MIEKLIGRDMINAHKIAHKVNELIEFLNEEGLLKDDNKSDKILNE